MTGRVAGKVALVTGAARGGGRANAVRLAEEGADIIAVDICKPLPGANYYPGAGEEDLAETVRLVEALGRRIVSSVADVRDIDTLTSVVDQGVTELGGLNIVSANAGVGTNYYPAHEMPEEAWKEMIDINLSGVWHTAKAAIPHLIASGAGGSIVITSSIAGMKGFANIANYVAAKHGVIGLMRSLAHELAPHMIRVNTVNPTQFKTPMIAHEREETSLLVNLMPLPWIEPRDVSHAVLFLASDEAQYITGVTLPVDLGALAK